MPWLLSIVALVLAGHHHRKRLLTTEGTESTEKTKKDKSLMVLLFSMSSVSSVVAFDFPATDLCRDKL